MISIRPGYDNKRSEVDKEIFTLHRAGTYTSSIDATPILVTGPDAERFLHSRTSNDIKTLSNGNGQLSTLLDRKAHVLSLFSIYKINNEYLILADTLQGAQKQIIIDELERYKFADKVEFICKNFSVFYLQGPLSRLVLRSWDPNLDPPNKPNQIVQYQKDDLSIYIIGQNFFAEFGYIIIGERNTFNKKIYEPLAKTAEEHGFRPFSVLGIEAARVEAGLFKYRVDVTFDNLLPETGLEEIAASYTKGCFLGQEVLARIKSFGAPARALVGLQFENESTKWQDPDKADRFAINSKIFLDKNEIGTIKSNVHSPTLGKHIAFALVNKQYRVPNEQLNISIDNKNYTVTVVQLPFYNQNLQSNKASEYYEAGIAEFATGDENKAIGLLRKAIDLDPNMGDAYEALGVVLSRQDKLDEAITLMKILEKIDPASIMAHTNLSVFYMQQGNKEAAEEEKAKAMSIRMEQLARQASKELEEKQKQEVQTAEIKSRISMFNQVIEIDPDDLFANYGLGNAYVELKDFGKAIPYLEKAISLHPKHTVAFLALGKAFQGMKQNGKAIEMYEKGIVVAAQRGDKMPLNEMQIALNKLKAEEQ